MCRAEAMVREEQMVKLQEQIRSLQVPGGNNIVPICRRKQGVQGGRVENRRKIDGAEYRYKFKSICKNTITIFLQKSARQMKTRKAMKYSDIIQMFINNSIMTRTRHKSR